MQIVAYIALLKTTVDSLYMCLILQPIQDQFGILLGLSTKYFIFRTAFRDDEQDICIRCISTSFHLMAIQEPQETHRTWSY